MEESNIIFDESSLTPGEVDLTQDEPEYIEQPKIEQKKRGRPKKEDVEVSDGELINCLRNESIKVEFIPKERYGYSKDHPYYGGLTDKASWTFTVPMLRNGTLKDPLTKSEKAFLEDYMGLEPNALSVHKKKSENYWVNFGVTVPKDGTVLNLATPIGYIQYKVLLLNEDFIAPSMQVLRDRPLETYKFVLVADNEFYNTAINTASIKSKAWKEYGKIEDDEAVLRCVYETITGKRVDSDSIEFLQARVVDVLEDNPKLFYSIVTDPLIKFKVLLRDAVRANVVDLRADQYYFKGTPLCGKNEEPTITVAAKYISNPKNQEILFSIQASLK